jgi:hypothetical protein
MPGEIVTEQGAFQEQEPNAAHFHSGKLAIQLAQELLFIHGVFEGFSPIDEDNRYLVVVLSAQFGIAVYIDLVPGEAATTGELR